MERDLRQQFDDAVGDDPGFAPGELALAAISEGGRMRRRRQRLTVAGVAAGVVLVMSVGAGLNQAIGTDRPVTVEAAMMPMAAASCTEHPVERDATDVLVFLQRGLAGPERAAVEAALSGDPRVAAVLFESRAQAYERFKVRWQDEPDLVAAVGADAFPESFRLRLVAASEYTAFRAQYATMAGVQEIIGRRCSTDAPVGGVL
ncbi:permease-like cell division protein FtsX [Paractinoplanes rishiriensis]|uniref:FtsX extracellular domain-containing protein n=1 Tax=Paractinoplanes rishiriensis TaxID=1050105 RepID=A0A919N1J5_9ACTN|nr:permease-like cell division protein FtsX [Actinoplanes rishiriensis]GIE97087.1 hypothetical protein Ari01nite_45520 [Actinoplanes rishiriensis]